MRYHKQNLAHPKGHSFSYFFFALLAMFDAFEQQSAIEVRVGSFKMYYHDSVCIVRIFLASFHIQNQKLMMLR